MKEGQPVVSHPLGGISDSLKVLSDHIFRMEEQWMRCSQGDAKAHLLRRDAAVRDMRLELLDVRKLALRDNDSARNLATEAKHLSDTQAIDLDSIQQKLSAHDDQLREVKEHVKRNDEKHQRSYEKLLDSMGALSVAQEKILEMLQPDSAVKYRPSRSPAGQPSAPGASATFTRDRPTKVEHRSSAFIKGSRAPSPSPLKITSEDLNQTSMEEVPEAEKEDVSKNEVPVVATEQPILSLRVETERVPEPKPVCTSSQEKTKQIWCWIPVNQQLVQLPQCPELK